MYMCHTIYQKLGYLSITSIKLLCICLIARETSSQTQHMWTLSWPPSSALKVKFGTTLSIRDKSLILRDSLLLEVSGMCRYIGEDGEANDGQSSSNHVPVR